MLYILDREIDPKLIIIGGGSLILILVLVIAYFLFFSRGGYDAELFSLMPSDGLKGVAYIEITDDGIDELNSVFGILIKQYISGIDRVIIASGSYTDESNVVAAFVWTDMDVQDFVERYTELSGSEVDVEELSVGGKKIYAIYNANDSTKNNPVCVWERNAGVGVLSIAKQFGASEEYCQFPSDISCRDQQLSNGNLNIKLKSEEPIILAEIACSEVSFSSKSLKYTHVHGIRITPDEETWVYGIPCYDSSNRLVEGNSVYGKIFIKYYLERTGPGEVKISTGNVGAIEKNLEIGPGKQRCLDLLGVSYSNSKALEMLDDSRKLSDKIPYFGDFLGGFHLKSEEGNAYVGFYEKRETNYLIAMGDSKLKESIPFAFGEEGARCVSDVSQTSEIVNKEEMTTCKRRTDFGLIKGTTYERRSNSGELLFLGAFPKTGDTVTEHLTDLIFQIELDGTDVNWNNETSGSVVVYFANETNTTPLENAEVELYSMETNGTRGNLMQMKKTNSTGNVIFENVPLTGSFVVVNMYGYHDRQTGRKISEGILTETNNFSVEVFLEESGTAERSIEDYILGSNSTDIEVGSIDARGVFPLISTYGLELVRLDGTLDVVVVVGSKAPPREVVRASHVAEILSARQYDCKTRMDEGDYGALPFDLTNHQILTLDDQFVTGPTIIIGDPETNSRIREKGILSIEGERIRVLGESIVILGTEESSVGTVQEFITDLVSPYDTCGGGTAYDDFEVVDSEGKPVKVIVGRHASTSEALAGAYLANYLASMSTRCARKTAESDGCASVYIKRKVLVIEDEVEEDYRKISVGGYKINNYTKANCLDCLNLHEGEAMSVELGGNIFISGFRLDDTSRVLDEFLLAVSRPLSPTQKVPYYAIKVSGFTEKDTGHHEVGLSFYDASKVIETETADVGKDYTMLEGRRMRVISISSRDLGSASVTFDLEGERYTVPMGKYICHDGVIEDSLKYCTQKRKTTTLALNVEPRNAILMEKLSIFADYKQDYGSVPDARCAYCIIGEDVRCGDLEYGWPYGDVYSDEIVLKNMSTGTYFVKVNCSAEGYQNATAKDEIYLTKMELPDLILEGLWVDSLVQTKMKATARIKNIGNVALEANSKKPLVVCIWDGMGRSLDSYALYNTTLQPGETVDITRTFILPLLSDENELLARADCNNIHPEEDEENNEKAVSFGKWG